LAGSQIRGQPGVQGRSVFLWGRLVENVKLDAIVSSSVDL